MPSIKPFLHILVPVMVLGLAACSNQDSGTQTRQAKPQHVLAFSWQPAFCETASAKPECRSQTADRFDAANFTLHGLWPQPGSSVYCGVAESEIARDKSGDWQRLDTPRIAEEIWQELREVMPGTKSALHEHEWIKHGTCYAADDIDRYYRDSLKLMRWINASSLRFRFEAAIGQEVTGRDLREAFERDFGRGAGKRLRMSCKRDADSGRQLIVEMTLGLAGDIAAAENLASLIEAAPETDPGCPVGIADPVGLQ